MRHKLIIGFITYGQSTAKYLPYFLNSLEKQDFKNFKVLAADNTEEEDNENKLIIKNTNFNNNLNINFFWNGKNIGFARAYNKMISLALEERVKYFLVVNPDVILEPDSIQEMVLALDNDKNLSSVAPKILKWDFKNRQKTNIIDSCGIKLKSGLRFIDIGQGKEDNGQYDDAEILGPSGACGMYRVKALGKVRQGRQYFDEQMFMYKEDCDLAYRLRLAGYKSKLEPKAVIYHDRTTFGIGENSLQVVVNRYNKSKQSKKWSFLNQQIIFFKYWRLQNCREKLAIVWYELKMFIYILFFEQYLLLEFWKLWKIRGKKILNQNS